MRKVKVLALAFMTLVLTLTLFSLPTNANSNKIKDLNADSIFNGVQGTLVLKNLKTDNVYAYNLKRSKERFTPESTFKVPNALIGLEVKAVADEYAVTRWDGTVREFEAWNRDHTLASAMRESAIWFYQDMARTIGHDRMQDHLHKIGYGNKDISGGIDTFWLDSSLRITAQEQMEFIEKLVEERLPFSKATMKTVKRIMISDEQDGYTIHGKTGTRLSDMGLGWFVGYVESGTNSWVFATNVDASGTTAKNITYACLEMMGVIQRDEG